jgi:hypothetical protein
VEPRATIVGATPRTRRRRPIGAIFAVALIASTLLPVAAITTAAPATPWDGNPISAGLGPTYGEAWCEPPTPGSSIANLQGAPLAIIPQEAIRCTLDQILAEGAAAGLPTRMSYSVNTVTDFGREQFAVIVNALETPEQQRDYDRWLQVRALMTTKPAEAAALLASFGEDVKLPVFIEANIHGGEREGTDAMMQVLRDLVTTPLGDHPVVDQVLNHSILIVIPNQNPDGRFLGTRANGNGFDMNRDLLVQSQIEIRANIRLQQEWLAPVMLAMHGYVNPTLVDGLTKPHNPGLEYDIFLNWNQRRLDANQAAYAAFGQGITRPVNQWNQNGGGSSGNPAIAEGWDDWGPFYTQTYSAFFGVDGSTLEMCSNTTCGGRYGSWRAQYVGFYSSADFWLTNRHDILADQLEIFERNVANAPRPEFCCDDPLLLSRGFDELNHNWMVEYPQAFVIPNGSSPGGHPLGFEDGQRSQAEANRLVDWLMANGVRVERTAQDYVYNGQTIPKKSYVVPMTQVMRGFIYTSLSAGQDISERITQLYAPPGAWSHGQLWGADTIEVPAGATFDPKTTPISTTEPLTGGLRGGGKVDFYALAIRGTAETKAVLDLLRSGVDGEVAESSFSSASAGTMPAGSVLFANTPANTAALAAAGLSANVWFERVVASAKPATTALTEAPTVAFLVNSANPAINDQFFSLRRIFGDDLRFVSATSGADSLQNAVDDPLADVDVIFNGGQSFPSAANTVARDRLNAFFARGGGYIATSVSANTLTFLTSGGLVTGSFTQGSASAGGGIASWVNVGGADSPVTGAYPASDFLYLPSNVTYYSAIPDGAVVDGLYPATDTDLFVAGLWRNRTSTASMNALSAPVVVHGTTVPGSRYVGLATNAFSRGDHERSWPLIAGAALWSNLTDE